MVKQKALLLLEKQGEFAVREVDVPRPESGEILVEIHSTGLNPVDWKIAKAGFAVDEYPAVLGSDAAGIVKELGDGVTGFEVGDKVVYQGWFKNQYGTFQQHSVVPADIAAKIPPNLTFDDAATIPLALATAAFGLYSRTTTPSKGLGLTPFWLEGGRGKYAGQPIVIIGGSSAVGQQVIQVARLSGFSPIITTASLHNSTYLQSLGATHVIDRNAPLLPAVQAITTAPITIAYDAISLAQTQNAAWDVLAPGGTLVLVLALSINQEKLDKGKEEGKTTINVYGTSFDPPQRELGASMYKHLTALLEGGDIKPNKVEVLPNGLAGIPDGLEKLRLDQVSASKLIGRPQETA